jgi:hypothetical protein
MRRGLLPLRGRADDADRDADRGTVLILTLVLVIVGGLITGGLLQFAEAMVRVRPPLDRRTDGAEAIRSATRMAITLQRDMGPRGCFTTAGGVNWNINGYNVNTNCTTLSTFQTGAGRYGLIVTSNRATDVNAAGPTGGVVADIDGPLFLNSGRVDGAAAGLMVRNADITYSSFTSPSQPTARYRLGASANLPCSDATLSTGDAFRSGVSQVNGTTYSHTHSCVPEAWWQRAGDNPGTGWVYPRLPQLPTFERPGPQATIGGCNVYYPGRYLGATPLVLDGGTHYFASGIYYFERPITITNGARVVFGEGRFGGCVADADAAFASTAPRSHEITGKGATLLLGAGSSLTVQNSSVQFNRRVSTSANRGSEGMSIRTINTGRATADVEIPSDQVMLPDGTTVPVASHSIRPSSISPPVSYAASTLNPTGNAVTVTLSGSSINTNRFIVDGQIFVPNARIAYTTTGNQYGLRVSGGMVTSALTMSLASLPTSPSTNYQLGVVTEFIQRKVQMVSRATVDGRVLRSTSQIEVHVDKSYAINLWVVDL